MEPEWEKAGTPLKEFIKKKKKGADCNCPFRAARTKSLCVLLV